MYVVGRVGATPVNPVTPSSQRAIHNQSVSVAETRVQERSWKPSNRGEAELLPEMNRRFIAADDKVELHGAETVSAGVLQRMFAHRGRHSTS